MPSSAHNVTDPIAAVPARAAASERRPRIAIMGEFSAGKSTLTNLLMGDSALPTRVTATQLPPVWLSHGEAAAHAEGLDGSRFDVDLAALGEMDVAGTRYLRVFRKAGFLEQCDLIDFPGISDPSMDADVWQRVVPLADAVLWCTHATQAWRQSEAAVWEDMPPEVRQVSLLLLTRMDRLPDARDRRRVVGRVARETEGLFAGIYPVSLTRALDAGEDRAIWAESGAEELMAALRDLVAHLSSGPTRAAPLPARSAPGREAGTRGPAGQDRTVAPFPAARQRPSPARGTTGAQGDGTGGVVLPRRVRPMIVRNARPGSGGEAARAPD